MSREYNAPGNAEIEAPRFNESPLVSEGLWGAWTATQKEWAELLWRDADLLQLLGFYAYEWGHSDPDVAISTVIEKMARSDKLEPGRRYYMFAKKIMHRVCIDDYRARQVRPPEDLRKLFVGRDGEESVFVDWSDDEDRIVNRLAAEALVKIIMKRLSAQHQQALTLVYLEDRTVPQAAEIAGIPLGTMKSRVSYAMANARRLADAYTGDPDAIPDV